MSNSSDLPIGVASMIGWSAGRRARQVGYVGLTALLLAGCSVPDSLNPAEWYRGVERAVSGDDTPTVGADSPYPNVGDVPGRPAAASAERRRQIANSLAADRENAKYTDEVVRRVPEGSGPAVAIAPATPRKPADTLRPADRPGVELRDGQLVVSPGYAPTVAPGGDPVPDAPPAPPVLRPTRSADRPPPPPRTPVQADPEPPPAAPTGMGVPVPPASEPVASPALAAVPTGMPTPVPTPAAMSDAQRLEMLLNRTYSNVDSAPTSPYPASGPVVASAAAAARIAPGQLAVVQFADGSANLSARDQLVIADAARLATQRGGMVRVVGHTADHASGTNAARREMKLLEISSRRAEAVAAELIRQGVPASSLVLEAAGSDRPRYVEATPAGIAANRRVEIYLDY